MAKTKNNKIKGSKPSVKVSDLGPKKDPKGGKATISDIHITKKVDKSSSNI